MEMKALSVRQPFASQIVIVEKTIEWNQRLEGEYGIDNLTFGGANVSLKQNADGSTDIKTDRPITVKRIQNGRTESRTYAP